MITMTEIFQAERLYHLEQEVLEQYGGSRVLYFDIETTGFSPKNHPIYLIGAAYKNENSDSSFTLVQWFDDSGNSEAKILLSFRELLKQFDVLVNYNGNYFDIPFIKERAFQHGMLIHFDKVICLDLYQEIRVCKKIFKTIDLKQRTMEQFLGTFREDQYQGGQLIEVYHDFLKTKDETIKKNNQSLLLLHNHDDLIGLVKVCDLMSYVDLWKGYYDVSEIKIERECLMIRCELLYPVRTPVFHMDEYLRMTVEENRLKLLIPIWRGELKYFYENYKEYFYLPKEDTAIHQSVGQFVDKKFRKRATRETCYIKRCGHFVYQPVPVFKPVFKQAWHDQQAYFEINADFIEQLNAACRKNSPDQGQKDPQNPSQISPEKLRRYVKELIQHLYKK